MPRAAQVLSPPGAAAAADTGAAAAADTGGTAREGGSARAWCEAPPPLDELAGWTFGAPELKKVPCVDLRQARRVAAAEVGGDADKCAIWAAEAQMLYVKGSASKYIPPLKGEQHSGRLTFYHSKGGPLVEADVADLSAAETWLPRWAYAVCARAEKLKSLGEQREKLKAAERAWLKKKLEEQAEEERAKQELLESCRKQGVDVSLFPPDDPVRM